MLCTMPTDLRSLLKKELRVRTTLDTVVKFVKAYNAEVHSDQVEVRLQLLEETYKEFKEVREMIEVLMDDIDEDVEEVDAEESATAQKARMEKLQKAAKATRVPQNEDFRTL